VGICKVDRCTSTAHTVGSEQHFHIDSHCLPLRSLDIKEALDQTFTTFAGLTARRVFVTPLRGCDN
jgi:hypothetical protein